MLFAGTRLCFTTKPTIPKRRRCARICGVAGVHSRYRKKFGIGYSPDKYSLVKFYRTKSTKRTIVLNAEYFSGSHNGDVFDALSYRLIIPIFNMQGKVIAFGGRGLTEEVTNYGKYKIRRKPLCF